MHAFTAITSDKYFELAVDEGAVKMIHLKHGTEMSLWGAKYVKISNELSHVTLEKNNTVDNKALNEDFLRRV